MQNQRNFKNVASNKEMEVYYDPDKKEIIKND
jgi:hypothetical protein